MKPGALAKLIRKSMILDIESDHLYYSHNLDQNEEFMKGRNVNGNMSLNKKLTAQQYFYNKVKKSQSGSTMVKPSNLSDTQDTTVINGVKAEEQEAAEFSPARIIANK